MSLVFEPAVPVRLGEIFSFFSYLPNLQGKEMSREKIGRAGDRKKGVPIVYHDDMVIGRPCIFYEGGMLEVKRHWLRARQPAWNV